jgi:hypothetical protein
MQLITQVQTCHHTDEEEDAKMTSHPHNKDLKTEQISQLTTQPPEEHWPTETHEVPETEKNRSLETKNETNQNTSDDNDEKEFVPNENKLPEDDDISRDDDKAAGEAINDPYTEPGDELPMQYFKRKYMTPIDVTASEDHDMMRIDYEPREELNEGADDAKTHDGERTPEPISTSTPKSQDS